MKRQALDKIYDEKKDSLKSPYDGDPNHAWYVVGDIYYKFEDFNRAIVAFDRAVSFREDDVEALTALANAYIECGKPELSEKTLRTALGIKPKDESLIYNLGNALFDKGEYESAIAEYSRISDSDPELKDKASKNEKIARDKLISKRKGK